MRTDLVPGSRLPDLELPDHFGRPVRLSALANGYPLVVSFYRGYWGPKCSVPDLHRALRVPVAPMEAHGAALAGGQSRQPDGPARAGRHVGVREAAAGSEIR